MGSSDDVSESQDRERPQHKVNLSQFLIGRYPVTQAQWRVVAGYDRVGQNLDPEPSRFSGDNRPVERVRWNEAVEFCSRLSTRTGKNYHLPSEAQWEYACRAETKTAYHFGDTITEELVNHSGYKQGTTDVGSYPPNRWGLCDMHGNVDEWCQDHWHENYKGAPEDGSAWIEGGESSRRVLRGSSWFLDPGLCRSASRNFINPDSRINSFGFRVCCSPP